MLGDGRTVCTCGIGENAAFGQNAGQRVGFGTCIGDVNPAKLFGIGQRISGRITQNAVSGRIFLGRGFGIEMQGKLVAGSIQQQLFLFSGEGKKNQYIHRDKPRIY